MSHDLQARLLAYHDSLGNEASRALIKDAMEANTRAAFVGSALLEALKPFAEAAEHLHPTTPDDGLTLDGIEVRHWRAARAAIALAERPAQVEGFTTAGDALPAETLAQVGAPS